MLSLAVVTSHSYFYVFCAPCCHSFHLLSSEYLLDHSMCFITPVFKERVNKIDYLQQQIEAIKLKLADFNLSYSAPDYGVCVGDLHLDNAHFTNKNQPTLFDFDQCGYGWRAFDITKFIQVTLWRKIDEKVIKCFINGYQTIRQLSTAELASILVFTKMAHIWVMGINCQVAGEVVPYGHFTDEWLDSKLALLAQLDNL